MNDLNMFAHGRGVGKSLLALKTRKKTYSFAMRINYVTSIFDILHGYYAIIMSHSTFMSILKTNCYKANTEVKLIFFAFFKIKHILLSYEKNITPG